MGNFKRGICKNFPHWAPAFKFGEFKINTNDISKFNMKNQE